MLEPVPGSTLAEHEISAGTVGDQFDFSEICALAVRRLGYPDALDAHGLPAYFTNRLSGAAHSLHPPREDAYGTRLHGL
jgi:hypothetical protein